MLASLKVRKSEVICIETSLVVQWLRIQLPMQGMWVQSLVGKLIPHALWHDHKIKFRSSLVAQRVKRLPAMRETYV